MGEDREQRQLRGYERMLERVTNAFEWAGDEARPRLRDALAWARRKAVELNELTTDEAERISEYLRRDVEDAARFLSREDRDDDLRGWFRLDLQLLENWLLDRFGTVADRTRLELMDLNRQFEENAEYHTGEIITGGELQCLACEKTLHFERAGHIPPCPACHATRFRRVTT